MVASLVAKIRSVHCGAYHTCCWVHHGSESARLGALSYEKGVVNDNGELAGDLWLWGRNRCICEHEHAKAGSDFIRFNRNSTSI